jgi:hypothetical protein
MCSQVVSTGSYRADRINAEDCLSTSNIIDGGYLVELSRLKLVHQASSRQSVSNKQAIFFTLLTPQEYGHYESLLNGLKQLHLSDKERLTFPRASDYERGVSMAISYLRDHEVAPKSLGRTPGSRCVVLGSLSCSPQANLRIVICANVCSFQTRCSSCTCSLHWQEAGPCRWCQCCWWSSRDQTSGSASVA